MKKRTVSLAKSLWAGLLLAGSVLAVLAGCSGDDSDKSSAAESSIETSSYASKEDLPSCTSKRMAEVELTEDGKMYVCYDESWKKIDYTESDVEDLPSCTEKRNGSVAFLSLTDGFVVCKNEKWQNQKNTDSDEVKESSSSVSPSSSGDADEGLENVSSSSSVKTSYVEVKTKSDLIECNSSNKDVRALVLKDSSYYTCNAKEWKKDEGYLGYDVVADRENLPLCNVGNAKQRVLAKKDSVFFVCDSVKWEPELAEGYLVQNASILGAAHKGPFKFDSPLLLREMLLRNDSLIYSGREYVDEISSNKGDFVIPKVNMVYPYAELKVRGLWRNEISGDWSKDSMTLRVLTDLTKRTDVNVNLLTHLEYDRAVVLVNKGYSVYAAKKQADYEIMTALGFATTVEYSEDLKTFVPSTSAANDENATLMAISLLFIGDRNESDIQKTISNFKSDLAEDGEWNNEQLKADMADWAESFDGGSVRANVKTWNIVDIPSYESYLTIFWNNAYGLGGCASTRYGVVTPNTNKSSKNYNVHYICEAKGWRKATDFEKDTYEWSNGKPGEVEKGNVTETYYVFENGEWSIATELQYDTYQFGVGKDGEVRKGKVNTDKYYVYENGAWRSSKNEVENTLGACVTNKDGEKQILSNRYYICENNSWKQISAEEYGLGFCTSFNEGLVKDLNGTFFVCKLEKWEKASVLEYDTYGLTCPEDGSIVLGLVNFGKRYVCDKAVFRIANDIEIYLDKGCVNYIEGKEIRKSLSKEQDSVYTCINSLWKGSVNQHIVVYDTLIDSRDKKIYKTVIIGKQLWMAENLNYSDSINYPSMLKRNWCNRNSLDSCSKYGRLYTWSAAMDSVGTFSTNGKNCGYDTVCSPKYPVRGICPEGWHIPTRDEWRTLFHIVDESVSGRELRSVNEWLYRASESFFKEKVVDYYGFSALPAGSKQGGSTGRNASFWCGDYEEYKNAAYIHIYDDALTAYDGPHVKTDGVSVRCIKDELVFTSQNSQTR